MATRKSKRLENRQKLSKDSSSKKSSEQQQPRRRSKRIQEKQKSVSPDATISHKDNKDNKDMMDIDQESDIDMKENELEIDDHNIPEIIRKSESPEDNHGLDTNNNSTTQSHSISVSSSLQSTPTKLAKSMKRLSIDNITPPLIKLKKQRRKNKNKEIDVINEEKENEEMVEYEKNELSDIELDDNVVHNNEQKNEANDNNLPPMIEQNQSEKNENKENDKDIDHDIVMDEKENKIEEDADDKKYNDNHNNNNNNNNNKKLRIRKKKKKGYSLSKYRLRRNRKKVNYAEKEESDLELDGDGNHNKKKQNDSKLISEESDNNIEQNEENEDHNNNNNDKALEKHQNALSEDSDDSDGDEDDPMLSGLTKEEKKLIKERMKKIQDGYKQNIAQERKLKLLEIQNNFKFNINEDITEAEASFIFDFCKKHQINVINKIEEEGIFFIQSMREMIHEKIEQQRLLKMSKKQKKNKKNNNDDSDWSASDYSDDDSEWFDSDFSADRNGLIDSDEDYDDDLDDPDWCVGGRAGGGSRRRRRKRFQNNKNGIRIKPAKGKNLDGSERCGRLLLNDALKDTVNFEGWSVARINAWQNRKEKPNAYYYRFNHPGGEVQKNGPLTMEEHKVFMERVYEVGTNVQWGIFSQKVPGRVGYQCSNYWRQLIKDGWVIDPNYVYDKKTNKLSFRRQLGNKKKKNT